MEAVSCLGKADSEEGQQALRKKVVAEGTPDIEKGLERVAGLLQDEAILAYPRGRPRANQGSRALASRAMRLAVV